MLFEDLRLPQLPARLPALRTQQSQTVARGSKSGVLNLYST